MLCTILAIWKPAESDVKFHCGILLHSLSVWNEKYLGGIWSEWQITGFVVSDVVQVSTARSWQLYSVLAAEDGAVFSVLHHCRSGAQV